MSLHVTTRRPVRKLAQRVLIASAGVLVILSAAGGSDLLGQAHADSPQCVADSADPCPPSQDGSADSLAPPRLQTTSEPQGQHHRQVVCQPTGKFGTFCSYVN